MSGPFDMGFGGKSSDLYSFQPVPNEDGVTSNYALAFTGADSEYYSVPLTDEPWKTSWDRSKNNFTINEEFGPPVKKDSSGNTDIPNVFKPDSSSSVTRIVLPVIFGGVGVISFIWFLLYIARRSKSVLSQNPPRQIFVDIPPVPPSKIDDFEPQNAFKPGVEEISVPTTPQKSHDPQVMVTPMQPNGETNAYYIYQNGSNQNTSVPEYGHIRSPQTTQTVNANGVRSPQFYNDQIGDYNDQTVNNNQVISYPPPPGSTIFLPQALPDQVNDDSIVRNPSKNPQTWQNK